jgi:hypothetical protein
MQGILYMDIDSLILSAIVAIISTVIGVAIGAYLTNRNEIKKIKIQKMEETAKIIHELVISVSKLAPYYDDISLSEYSIEKFSYDLDNISIKSVTCLILIQMYIGQIDGFSEAFQLLVGENGFIQKRERAASKLRSQGIAELPEDTKKDLVNILNEACSQLAKTQIILVKRIQYMLTNKTIC